jgi:hypothetical protein
MNTTSFQMDAHLKWASELSDLSSHIRKAHGRACQRVV